MNKNNNALLKNLLGCPDEILILILLNLSPKDILLGVALSCRSLKKLSGANEIWKPQWEKISGEKAYVSKHPSKNFFKSLSQAAWNQTKELYLEVRMSPAVRCKFSEKWFWNLSNTALPHHLYPKLPKLDPNNSEKLSDFYVIALAGKERYLLEQKTDKNEDIYFIYKGYIPRENILHVVRREEGKKITNIKNPFYEENKIEFCPNGNSDNLSANDFQQLVEESKTFCSII